jgi:hypothetical protein
MRNKFVLTMLFLFLASGLVWAQFWKGYDDNQRKATAESYWLVGKQYQSVGKSDEGSQFMALAKIIYPQLDPASIKDQQMPSAAELLAHGKASAIGAGASTVPTAALSSFFLRFVGALLDGNATAVTGFLDGSLYLTKVPVEVTRADAEPALASFFKDAPLSGLEPSAVYDLDTVVITKAPQSMQTAWGETYTLSVNAKTDYSKYVSFWDMKQQYFVRRTPDGWRIFALGQNPPPLAWKPQSAAAVVAAAPPASTDAGLSKVIADGFTQAMTAILSKNADPALASMSQNVRFLRLRQTVTKEELKTSLLGYFDNPNFEQAPLGDVLDLDSIFVQPDKSPVDGIEGPVYVLNVRAKADLSSTIPFWSTYQKYYFVQEDSQWVVFAIL